MPMTDHELAQAIAVHPFEEREGLSVLPPRTHPLGARLYRSLVRENGDVNSALRADAQAALQAKGFTLARTRDGRKTGLHPDTPRTGAKHQPSLADDQLAQAIAAHTFEEREGRPVLPPQSHPLGARLNNALVNEKGSVPSALRAGAQAALQAKGFTLARTRDGRKTGLHPDTLRAGGRHRRRQVTRGQAHAVVPDPGAQDFATAAPASPGRDPRDLRAAAAAARAPSGAGGPLHAPTPLPRVEVIDMPLPQLAALAKRVTTVPTTHQPQLSTAAAQTVPGTPTAQPETDPLMEGLRRNNPVAYRMLQNIPKPAGPGR
ncbi:hypothetical protein OG215_37935 (plasmid) [Streptomyces globisporus]|uniref:hypothetical protein n=1 Tax=Streptomyces globisporus TaxID=1908 RepID=UPI002F9111ED|nr:hypothetical protein OG215_36900 [Streptomyces globisporus]WSU86422.1 hypothetical protein OG215_37935 [Streptomyces globisporus]